MYIQIHSEDIPPLRARIMEYKNGYLFIDSPINTHTRKTKPLQEGMNVTVSFVRPGSGMYQFETKVVKRYMGKIMTYLLKDPGVRHYKNIQQREYFRVNAMLDVDVTSPIKGAHFRTTTVDISGGGMAIVLPKGEFLEKGEAIVCSFTVDIRETRVPIAASCQVVRTFQKRKDSLPLAALKFQGLHETDRQHIIHFCFEQQRKWQGGQSAHFTKNGNRN